MKRKTGYYVWVGGEKRWFRSLDRATKFYMEMYRVWGPAVCQIIDVATGDLIAGNPA